MLVVPWESQLSRFTVGLQPLSNCKPSRAACCYLDRLAPGVRWVYRNRPCTTISHFARMWRSQDADQILDALVWHIALMVGCSGQVLSTQIGHRRARLRRFMMVECRTGKHTLKAMDRAPVLAIRCKNVHLSDATASAHSSPGVSVHFEADLG